MFYVALALPFIGALHQFSMSYGYRGVSRNQARNEAWRVAAALSIISVAVMFKGE